MTTTTVPIATKASLHITEHWMRPLHLTAGPGGERLIERAFSALSIRGYLCTAVWDHDDIPCHGELDLWVCSAGMMAQTLQATLRVAGIASVIDLITLRASGGGDRVYSGTDLVQVEM